MVYMTTTQAAYALDQFMSTTPGALTVAVVLGLLILGLIFAMR